MADLSGIGNMLAGIGAGFSGNGPQYMYAQQQQKEADALADDRRRQALMRDFVTGYSLLNSGQVDQAKTLFTHRLDMLKKLNAPDMSDTQAIVDRLNAGKVDEVTAELGSFVQAGMATGDLKGLQGGNSQKGQTFAITNPETGQVELVGSTFDPTSGQWGAQRVPLGGGEIVGPSGVAPSMRPGQKYAETAAQQAAVLGAAGPIAQSQAQGRATVEAATAPQIAADTAQAQETAKADVTRDTQRQISAKAGDTLDAAANQVITAFSKVNTGPLMGKVPAAMRDSTAYQTAEGAAGQYRAQMRKIIRPPGSGPWTDTDEEKLSEIVPKLTDTLDAAKAKIQQGRQLYDAQMGKPQGGTSNPMEGKTAVNPTTGQKIRMVNGQWVPL
jgi:hypothetical protein